MKKDIYTNSRLACDDVFADIANVNLMPEEVRERYRSDYRVIADYLEYRDQGKKVLMEKMRDNTTPPGASGADL